MIDKQRLINQLKELHKELGILEALAEYDSSVYEEVRNKMIDIHYYHEKLYILVSWNEFTKIQDELDEIRINARKEE